MDRHQEAVSWSRISLCGSTLKSGISARGAYTAAYLAQDFAAGSKMLPTAASGAKRSPSATTDWRHLLYNSAD